jgi:3-dehydroquinate synthase
VKRAVVEYDEFEINLRRSMNYGHSIGHAFESLTNFQFPHGMGISIGMIIENLIAVKLFGLARETANEINQLCCKLIDNEAITSIKKMNIKGLNDVLQKDKKVIGDKLFLAVPIKLGEMSFCAIELNDKLIQLVQEAVEEFLGLFQ